MMSSDDIWAGEVAQAVKCLLHKGEDLNLTPRISVNVLGMVSAAFVIPALDVWKREPPLGLVGRQPTGESQANGKLHLKSQMQGMTRGVVLWSL